MNAIVKPAIVLESIGEPYPSEADLERVSSWPYSDIPGLFAFVQALWHYPDYASVDGQRVRLVTGGWSGNEQIIAALRQNQVAWALCWVSSNRGGAHEFEVPQ